MEKYEKVIMMMATELKNIQEGKEPQIANGRERALEASKEEVEMCKAEKEELEEKLKDVRNDLEKAEETIKTRTQVVESVCHKNKEGDTGYKNKKHIKCREFNKPKGCAWGDRCKFDHGEVQRLGKEADCSRLAGWPL